MNFCTVADKNYLTQGLTMYYSLKKHNPDFRMHWLALDYETFEAIKDHEIAAYQLSDVIDHIPDNDLTKKESIYALTPTFVHYLLDTQRIDELAHVDADIYFLNDWQIIRNELFKADVGIHEHRINYYKNTGRFNVGFVYFRNNTNGRECAEFWKKCTWDKHNPYWEEYGTCHDQKYLELFEKHYDNVHIIQSHHLAAWNFKNHTYYEGKVGYKGVIDKPIFIHFSHFRWDSKGYTTQHENEWGAPEKLNEFVRNYYNIYYEAIKQTECAYVSL